MGQSNKLGRGALSSAAVVLVLAGVGCASDVPGDGGTEGNGVLQPGGGTIPGGGSMLGGTGGTGVVQPPPGGGIVGTAGTTGGIGPDQPATGSIPCAVDTVVKSRCQVCHGATPIGGAPMSLVTLADFQKDHTVAFTTGLVGQTMKVYELSKIRIQPDQGTKRMPQGSPLSDPDFATLDGWLAGGAQAGEACGVGAGGTGGTGIGTGGTGGIGVAGGGGDSGGVMGATNECEIMTNYEPLVARDGETCYDFLTHNNTGVNDTEKFAVPPNESYSQLYYSVPWPPNTVATRFGADFDNLAVLHHWLGFKTDAVQPGVVSKNVLGTTLGENTELVGGWAVGGCNTEFPADMGLKLPDGGGIMIQWHHYNKTGTTALDGSVVQWCTVPAGMRANIGGLTFLGTEYLGMPPGISDVSGSCLNDSGGDITIVGFDPHMHTIGINMKSVITRANGMDEVVFDKPFQFDYQVNYMMHPPVVLHAGETITSTCTYNNTTPSTVDFGQSTNQEMCYQFAFSYPYGALNNGVISLIGSTNTCW